MSGIEMKNKDQSNIYTTAGQSHTYPGADPPPYSPPQTSYGPTMMQPVPTTVIGAPTTVIAPGTTVIHGPGIVAGPSVSAIVVSRQMSPNATVFICPSCNQQIVTRVDRQPSLRTHLFALLLCLVGCWPLVCVPYCMDSCNNADHYCPNCNAFIGSYRG